jgi:hypothetical protein
MQFFQHFLVIEDPLDDIELFPLYQHLSIGQQQISLGNVIVYGLKDIKHDCQHVAAIVKRYLFIFNSHGISLMFLVEIFL